MTTITNDFANDLPWVEGHRVKVYQRVKRSGALALVSVAAGLLAVTMLSTPATAEDAMAAPTAADARHDYATEFKLLLPLAEQGNAAAQASLGVMYAYGEGVPKNDAEALRWYRKAADQGNSAGEGLLALMYRDGQGVPQNDAEAVRWFRMAASHGNAVAQAQLAARYVFGGSAHFAEAAFWSRKAAEQGNAAGQAILGSLYMDGDGVPKDFVQAYMWLNLAAAGGSDAAVTLRDDLEHLMTAGQIAEGQEQSAAWQPTR